MEKKNKKITRPKKYTSIVKNKHKKSTRSSKNSIIYSGRIFITMYKRKIDKQRENIKIERFFDAS